MRKRENVFGLTCPSCNKSFEKSLNTAVFSDTYDRTLILNDEFGLVKCPSCGHEFKLNYRFVYTDDHLKFMIINDPKFVDVKNRIALRSSINLLDKARKNEAEKYLTRMSVDLTSLKEKIIIFESYLSDRVIELMKYMLLESSDIDLNHDDVIKFLYSDDGNFKITKTNGEVLTLPFLKEVYDSIGAKYEPYFEDDKPDLVDKAWAYEFLKKIK